MEFSFILVAIYSFVSPARIASDATALLVPKSSSFLRRSSNVASWISANASGSMIAFLIASATTASSKAFSWSSFRGFRSILNPWCYADLSKASFIDSCRVFPVCAINSASASFFRFWF